jgi:hypothetical protein
MSQPEAQPQMPVLTAVQRCRDKLIAKYGIEVVTNLNIPSKNANIGTFINPKYWRPCIEYIPIAEIVASKLLAVTPPIAVEDQEKVARTISTCIFKFIQMFMPDNHYNITTDIKGLGFCLRGILLDAYFFRYITTDLYCLLATRLSFIVKQCYKHLYVLPPLAKPLRECVSCGRSEPPPQLL